MDAADIVERSFVGTPVGVATYGDSAVEVVDVAPRSGDVGRGGYCRDGRIDEHDHHAIVVVADGTAYASAESEGEAAVD